MAVLLLPVSPTWAQKPEQKGEVQIVVKSDVNSAQLTDVARVVEDANQAVAVRNTSAGDDVILTVDDPIVTQHSEKPEVVHLEVKTDDSSVSVTADSLKVALAKLKEQINAITAKLSPSDREKAKKALERVVKELQTELTKQAKSGAHRSLKVEKGKPEVHLRIEKLGDKDLHTVVGKAEVGPVTEHTKVLEYHFRRLQDAKVSPETKAKIEKVRAEVKELARSLEANQRKLIEAQKRLFQLEGSAIAEVHAPLKVVVRGGRLPESINAPLSEDIVVHSTRPAAKGKSADKKPAETKRVIIRERTEKHQGDEQNQARIADLEKKLQKLLEEVASLKKERAK
jgi:hypothetical protein